MKMVFLSMVFIVLSGCVVENSMRLSPADYLSSLAERQCISSVDEGIRERGMSAFGSEQDHARWHRELERCDRVEACVKSYLDETGLFRRDDWSVVERFFNQRDVTIRQRVDIIRPSFNSCHALP